MKSEKFFRRSDWIAAITCFVISLTVYILTLQPTVGLEDSGELIVASDYLGVPHPPGYPIWTLMTWFFQWVFHAVTFHGHPNPAWAVNLFSAVAGAGACGVLALLISRSGMDLLRSMKKESALLGEKTESLFCAVAGISGGLLLAFGHGMWSQSVIAEVYTFNILFQSLLLLFLYRWIVDPKDTKWLLLCAFAFGLGITNHQTLMFMGLAMATAILLNDSKIFNLKYLWQILGAMISLVLIGAGVYYGKFPLQLIGITGCIAACLLIRESFLVKDFMIGGVILLLLILSTGAIELHAENLAKEIATMTSLTEKIEASATQHLLLNSLWGKGWHHAGFWLFLIGIVSAPILLAINPKPRNIAIITACFGLLFIGIDLQARHQMKPHNELIEKSKETVLTQAEHQKLHETRNGASMQIFQQDVILNEKTLQVLSPENSQKGKTFTFKGFKNPVFTTAVLYLFLIPGLLFLRLPYGKIVGATFLVVFTGLAFYLYMPFSSDQNPPINWGYPRTWQGFMHAITRGQYSHVKLASVFTPRFLQQVGTYLMDLRSQFYGPIALIGLVPFAIFSILEQKAGQRLNFKGRISRTQYFFWISSWNMLSCIALLLLVPLGTPYLISGLILLVLAHSVPIIKRLHDLGRPGFLFGLIVIPILGNWLSGYLWFRPDVQHLLETKTRLDLFLFSLTLLPLLTNLLFFYLWTRKGTNGSNPYGSDPLEDPDLAQKNTNRSWILTSLVAFLSVGIVFMVLQNPKTDIQSLFVGRVQYIQSHAIYVAWLGYGILLLMVWLESLVKNNPITKVVGVTCVLLLPLALIYKNYNNPDQLRTYGGANQNGHDFGWQFGNWQLQGVDGIKEDMQAWYSPEEFEKQWAAYPNKNYPEPMGTNAIFFGGTDPGRFVPTYMIYSAKVRQDVYLITQNALADNTYIDVMRDLYGDQIWIPSPMDGGMAFQKFLDSNAGAAGVDVSGGKTKVYGNQNVMIINGYLSQGIFNHNQYITETKTDEATRPCGAAVVHNDPAIDPKTGKPPLRSFYVEESYALKWMYPYLTPHGLIMKINNKPTPITAEMIKNDTDFWNWYCARLLNDEKFRHDIAARRSFSKLRTSLAGLYAVRGKPREAEAAFHQAIELYDLSPEVHMRISSFFARQGRFDDAIAILDGFLEKDPNSESIRTFKTQIEKTRTFFMQRQQLEQKLKSGNIQFHDAMQLISIYLQTSLAPRADALAKQMLDSNTMTPPMLMQLAQHMARGNRLPVVEMVLKKYTTIQPRDPKGWINLAALQVALKKQRETWVSIDKAIEIGGESTRNFLRKDKRFDSIRNTKEFQKRIPLLTRPGIGFGPLPQGLGSPGF